jgi:ribosomal protein S18 acetylase RimI-like enzyme
MPPSFTLSPFTPADVDPVSGLQARYIAANPGAATVPVEMYLSPYFAGGENVRVARDAAGCAIAYGVFFPQDETAWVEIRAEPGREDAGPAKDGLHAWLLDCARKGGQKKLAFQYAPGEGVNIAYCQQKGAAYVYTVFNMARKLADPLPAVAVPPGFSVQRWRLQSESERLPYLAARNAVFPEAPTSPEELSYFVSTPHWGEHGLCAVALVDGAGEDAAPLVAAGVMVYWEPGAAAGSTEYIFTRPDYRGKGLARALIGDCLRYLRDQGMEYAALEVRAANDTALGLYRQLGYTVTGETLIFAQAL